MPWWPSWANCNVISCRLAGITILRSTIFPILVNSYMTDLTPVLHLDQSSDRIASLICFSVASLSLSLSISYIEIADNAPCCVTNFTYSSAIFRLDIFFFCVSLERALAILCLPGFYLTTKLYCCRRRKDPSFNPCGWFWFDGIHNLIWWNM